MAPVWGKEGNMGLEKVVAAAEAAGEARMAQLRGAVAHVAAGDAIVIHIRDAIQGDSNLIAEARASANPAARKAVWILDGWEAGVTRAPSDPWDGELGV